MPPMMSRSSQSPGWVAVLLLILFWPVGIVLTWRTNWTDRTKVVATTVSVGLIGLLILPST